LNSKPGSELPFRMIVRETTYRSWLGTSISGKVEQGTIRPGDLISILNSSPPRSFKVKELQMFQLILDYAEIGENVAVLLEGYAHEEVEAGSVLVKVSDLGT
jgi:elongation factor Tu